MADMHRLDRNEDWNNSYSDVSSSDEDIDDTGVEKGGQGSGKMRSTPKRMAEDKLHEKRLKERARRNGMAKSIDQMRLIVPELMDAKKVYSQAKVVAIALQHIYELQRENGDLRQRLGMKPRDQEPRPIKGKRGQNPSNAAPKREAPPPDMMDERAKKRRRVDEPLPAVAQPAPLPSAPIAPLPTAPKPPTAAALLALLPHALPSTTTTTTKAATCPPPPVRLRGDVLEGAVVDSSSPSSFEEEDMMVSDTPLTLSPRRVDDSDHDLLYGSYSYQTALWEEHDAAQSTLHISHDNSMVDMMLQSVLSGTN